MIERRKSANLVLLGANALANVSNTRNIGRVMKKGRFVRLRLPLEKLDFPL